MLGSNAKQWILGAASAVILMSSSSSAFAQTTTNINLAVASNFFGIPPNNSAITDIITAFQNENPGNTVTVVDNGATATLEANIINGNTRGVDLFLAADTETPQDLVLNHFDLVTAYNDPPTPPLFTFNYAQGILALLTNTPWINLSCSPGGTCGYDPVKFANIPVGIADPSLAPYGVASQSVLIGRYLLAPPLCMSTTSNGNIHVKQPCYPNITASLNAVLNREVAIGFVAMSAICSQGIYPTPGNGTSAFAYFAIESSNTTPPTLVNNYNPLTQAGVAVVNTPAVTPGNPSGRTPAQNTELNDFVAFLTDFTQPPTPELPMMTTLKKFCYSAP